MKNKYIFSIIIPILLLAYSSFSQIDTANLKLWLKADAGITLNGSSVSDWADQSGNGNNATQTTGASQPLFVTNGLNNLPVLRFDGSNDFFNGTTIPNINTSSISIFVVAKGEAQTSIAADFFGIGSITNGFTFTRRMNVEHLSMHNNNAYISFPSLPNAGFPFKILEGIKNYGEISELLINGVSLGTSTDATLNGTFTNTNFHIGRNLDYDYFKGEIAEIILYMKALNNTERQQVEQYLMDKYAPSAVNLGPDIYIDYGFCDVELDAGEGYLSYSWSTTETTSSISVSQSGIYSVTTTDIFNRVSYDTINVTIYLEPNLTFSNNVLCYDTSYVFYVEDFNAGTGYTIEWFDSTISDTLTLQNYEGLVWAKVTDSIGCFVYTDTMNVSVDYIGRDFTLGNDTTFCSGNSLSILDNPFFAQIDTIVWSTGDTTYSTVIDTSDAYSIIVISDNGCYAYDTINVTITGAAPAVNFNFSDVCFGDTVFFIDTSVAIAPDNIQIWMWVAENDTTYTQYYSNVFDSPGFHSVSLTITTDSGCVASAYDSAYVISNLVANFIPVTGCSDKPIPFNNLSTNDYGIITDYKWTLFDNNNNIIDSSQNTNFVYTFNSSAYYKLRLVVITDKGCIDTILKTIDIRQTPSVDFSYSPTCFGETTYFTEETEVPIHDPIIDRKWWFGDGATSTIPNPSHNYTAAGVYDVRLMNRTMGGCADTLIKVIAVHKITNVGFEHSQACLNLPVQFFDTTQYDSIVEWQWVFGSFATANAPNPVVWFPYAGEYNVTLTVTISAGCEGLLNKQIEVYPYPTASFDWYPDFGVSPLEVQFYNNSTGANSYVWNFGDGSTSVEINPTHVFLENNIFTVTLIASNQFGCSDTAYGSVHVVPPVYDIAITDMMLGEVSGMISVSVKLQNFGTKNIHKLKMHTKVDNNIAFYEIWQGFLGPAQEVIYPFSTLFSADMKTKNKFICASAYPFDDIEDDRPENNTFCIAFDNSFDIVSIYPNPATEEIYVLLVIPEDEKFSIDITGTEGKVVISEKDIAGVQGFNLVKINVISLSQGVYMLRAYDNKNSVVKSIAVIKNK